LRSTSTDALTRLAGEDLAAQIVENYHFARESRQGVVSRSSNSAPAAAIQTITRTRCPITRRLSAAWPARNRRGCGDRLGRRSQEGLLDSKERVAAESQQGLVDKCRRVRV